MSTSVMSLMLGLIRSIGLWNPIYAMGNRTREISQTLTQPTRRGAAVMWMTIIARSTIDQ